MRFLLVLGCFVGSVRLCATEPDAITVYPLVGTACPSNLQNCVANDVVTTVVDAFAANGSICLTRDDVITVTFTVKFETTAATRYNLGVYIAMDGLSLYPSPPNATQCEGIAPQAGDGNRNADLSDCDVDLFLSENPTGHSLPNSSSIDTCGDLKKTTGPVWLTVVAVDISCNSIDSELSFIVPSCRVWQQNGNTQTACTSLANAGTGSKCDCTPLNLSVALSPCITALCDDGNDCTIDTCVLNAGQAECVHTNQTDTVCTDGNYTTGPDMCQNGICIGPPIVCDDNNSCTTDTIALNGGCVFTNNNDPCSDGNACTENDVCSGGICVSGTAVVCPSTGTLCIVPQCIAPGGCVNITQPEDTPCGSQTSGLCDDADRCDAQGVCLTHHHPDEEICDETPPGACLLPFWCISGTCVFQGYRPEGTVCRASQSPCDVPEECTGTNGTCPDDTGPFGLNCNDNNACTVDVCVDGLSCNHTELSCATGSLCTQDSCNTSLGCISEAVGCDDNNECTTDSCVEGTGCVSTFNQNPCSDGNYCTLDDICDNGTCSPGAPKDCTVNNTACQLFSCDPSSGDCVPSNVVDGTSCSDGLFCNGLETCQTGLCVAGVEVICVQPDACKQYYCSENGAADCSTFTELANGTACGSQASGPCDNPDTCFMGTCQANHHPVESPCGTQGRLCVHDDYCDGDGHCQSGSNKADGTECGAANGDCDLTDTCAGGQCVDNVESNATVCRLAAGDCDIPEYCDGISHDCPQDVLHGVNQLCRPAPLPCDRPEYCDGSSADCPPDAVYSPPYPCGYAPGPCDEMPECDGENKTCPSTVTVTCPVYSLCSLPHCEKDITTNRVSCVYVNTTCYSGTACAESECDEQTGNCTNTSISCDDHDVCTDDFCDPTLGCYHTNSTSTCDDGDLCTTNDRCNDGMCVGDPIVCPTDECHSGLCVAGVDEGGDPIAVCTLVELTGASCSDPGVCMTNGTCRTVGDVSGCFGQPIDCDDSIDCTVDSCIDSVCCHVADDSLCSGTLEQCHQWQCDAGAQGGCVQIPGAAGAPCGSSQPSSDCDLADSCDADGFCLDNWKPDSTYCGNLLLEPCEKQDICYQGACMDLGFWGASHQCAAAVGECDLPAFCTLGTGLCPPNARNDTVCDDENACTADECDLNGNCQHRNLITDCTDSLFCTVGDFCLNGTCQSGLGSPCTLPIGDCRIPVCSENDTSCSYIPNNAFCDDNRPCTLDSCDAETGQCVNEYIDCDDGLDCTLAACNQDTGFCEIYTQDHSQCADNNTCTIDSCVPRSCAGGSRRGAFCATAHDCPGGTCSAVSAGCAHFNSPGCCQNCALSHGYWKNQPTKFRLVVSELLYICFNDTVPPVDPIFIMSAPVHSSEWIQLAHSYFAILADAYSPITNLCCEDGIRTQASYFGSMEVLDCFAFARDALTSAFPAPTTEDGVIILPPCAPFPPEFDAEVNLTRIDECKQILDDFVNGRRPEVIHCGRAAAAAPEPQPTATPSTIPPQMHDLHPIATPDILVPATDGMQAGMVVVVVVVGVAFVVLSLLLAMCLGIAK